MVNCKGIIVYENCCFDGIKTIIKPGVYKLNDLKNIGINDNTISSLIVPKEYSIEIYENGDFTGRNFKAGNTSETLAFESLKDYNFDNKISSIIVKKLKVKEPYFNNSFTAPLSINIIVIILLLAAITYYIYRSYYKNKFIP
jgi:hypothetical protein